MNNNKIIYPISQESAGKSSLEIVFIEAVALPNGEVIHNGKTLFWLDTDSEKIEKWLFREKK